MKLGNKRPSQFGTAFLLRPRVGSGVVGLSHIVKLEGHESDDLGQLMVGVKGFEPSPSSWLLWRSDDRQGGCLLQGQTVPELLVFPAAPPHSRRSATRPATGPSISIRMYEREASLV